MILSMLVDSLRKVQDLNFSDRLALAKFMAAPFERIKIILDTQTTLNDNNSNYNGVVDALTEIQKQQGIFALWKGNVFYMIRYIPSQIVFILLEHRLNKLFVTFDKTTEYRNYMASKIVNGSLLASAALAVTYPIDVIRIQIEADTSDRCLRARDIVKSIRKVDDVRGFYFGFITGLAETISKRALYLLTFDVTRSYFHSGASEPPLWKKWIISQGVTVFSVLLTYPLANIRHRMAVQAGKEHKKYNNSIHCARTVLKEEGIKGFYSGAIANIIRGSILSVTLVLHDFAASLLSQ